MTVTSFQAGAVLGQGRMRQFCRRHSYQGGKSAGDVTSRLQSASASANPIAEQVLEAIVRAQVAQIRLLNAEIAGLERQTAIVLAARPKTALLTGIS